MDIPQNLPPTIHTTSNPGPSRIMLEDADLTNIAAKRGIESANVEVRPREGYFTGARVAPKEPGQTARCAQKKLQAFSNQMFHINPHKRHKTK